MHLNDIRDAADPADYAPPELDGRIGPECVLCGADYVPVVSCGDTWSGFGPNDWVCAEGHGCQDGDDTP